MSDETKKTPCGKKKESIMLAPLNIIINHTCEI